MARHLPDAAKEPAAVKSDCPEVTTAPMLLDHFWRDNEELVATLGVWWETAGQAEPGSDDQRQALVILMKVLHQQLIWLVAEADPMELVAALALTTAPMATPMATEQ
jgi:hypothetical protein